MFLSDFKKEGHADLDDVKYFNGLGENIELGEGSGISAEDLQKNQVG